MDDLLLFTPTKLSHFEKLEDLLKALCKNGLKISPKKCQLFKTDLQYMGNTVFIRNKIVCVRPLRSQIEAIQKLKPPTTIKGCQSFVGMVNFVSIFCPKLQKLLKPIYDLTRKGRQFIWGEEQQKAFDDIKLRLQRPQSYIYPTDMDGSNCIQILVSSPLVVCCTKFRMDSQGSLLMPAKEWQRQPRTILSQN